MEKGKVKQKEPIDKIVRPFLVFANLEASGGILLLISTVIALVWANSPWSDIYKNLWHLHFGFEFGNIHIKHELLHWINDGLMAIFFFVVGMEIKRELIEGELSTAGKAILPIVAAIGGMIVPAAFFLILNVGSEGAPGWGIPMATDIAFAMGAVILIGKKVPSSLKIFLLALAIVDDLGAVLVIAFFYTANISFHYLELAGLVFFVLIIANRTGVRNSLIYCLLGMFLWYAVLKSGIHSTIAGVLLAACIPLRSRINAAQFIKRCKEILEHFQQISVHPEASAGDEDQQLAVKALEENCDRVEAPLRRFQHALHPWVSFLIMPVFAMANAGIVLDISAFSRIAHPVGLGIIIGLVFGKQIGITVFSWLAVKIGIAKLPDHVRWSQIYGLSCLGGIGFTMSLFVAGLAFGESHLLSIAKLGILVASIISAVIGTIILSFSNKR